MAGLSEASLQRKITLLSFLKKSNKPVSVSELRDEHSISSHHRINTELQDMVKMGLAAKKKGTPVKFNIKKKGDDFLKDNSSQIVSAEKLVELFGIKGVTRRKSTSYKKLPDLDISSAAQLQIAQIMEGEKTNQQNVKLLLTLEAMIGAQLDVILPERIQEQDTET